MEEEIKEECELVYEYIKDNLDDDKKLYESLINLYCDIFESIVAEFDEYNEQSELFLDILIESDDYKERIREGNFENIKEYFHKCDDLLTKYDEIMGDKNI